MCGSVELLKEAFLLSTNGLFELFFIKPPICQQNKIQLSEKCITKRIFQTFQMTCLKTEFVLIYTDQLSVAINTFLFKKRIQVNIDEK